MPESKETTFTWIIKHFDMCPHLPGHWLESPTFSIDKLKETKFSLYLYPKGLKKNEDDNYISLVLKRHDDNGKYQMHIEYELCFIDSSGNPSNTQKSECPFYKNYLRGYGKFYERNLLLHSVRHQFLPNNELTVRCQISSKESESKCEHPQNSLDCGYLSQDFAELLVSGIHSDMTILIKGKEFKVHKTILEHRCPQLLNHLIKLEDSKAYTLPHVEIPVMQAMLHYFYSGTFRDSEIVENVLIAANTYGLSDLKALLVPYPKSITAMTEISVFQVVCDWIIERFQVLQQNKELTYHMISDEKQDWTWMKFSLFQMKDGNYALKFKRIYTKEFTFIQCEIKSIEEKGKCNILKKCEHTFENESEWIVQIDFSMEQVNKLLKNCALHLQLGIRLSAKRKYEEIKEISFHSVLQETCDNRINNYGNLQEDFRNLYENMVYGDLILCVGDEKLPAHKAILCSRSKVFLKMFEHETLEKETDIINIKDIDVPTMASILKYIYCGDTDGPACLSTAIKTYAAADKYELLNLREKCCSYLKSNMSAETFGDVLILADGHHDKDLKESVYKFILSHPKEVLNAEKGLNVLHDRMDMYRDILNVLLRNLMQKNDDCGNGKIATNTSRTPQ